MARLSNSVVIIKVLKNYFVYELFVIMYHISYMLRVRGKKVEKFFVIVSVALS